MPPWVGNFFKILFTQKLNFPPKNHLFSPFQRIIPLKIVIAEVSGGKNDFQENIQFTPMRASEKLIRDL